MDSINATIGYGMPDSQSITDGIATVTAAYEQEVGPEDTPDTPDCKTYKFVINVVVIGIVCIIGLLGNIVAFIVFCKDTVKTSSSFLFQALSLIDSALLILVFPLYCVTELFHYTELIPKYALVYPFVLVAVYPCAIVAQTSTIWVTVLVGVNRYIAVCKPYQAPRLCTVNQAKKQLAAVLLFAFIYNIPKFAEGKINWLEHNDTYFPQILQSELGKNKLYNIIYSNILYTIFMLSIPLVILTVLNIRLINALKKLSRRRAEMQSLRQQQDNNVTLVLVVVIIVFTVCQAPALVNQILWNTLPDNSRACHGFQFYFRPLSNTLVILNSAVNFFIYLFFNTRFRMILKSCICPMQMKKDYEKVRTTTNSTQVPQTTTTSLTTSPNSLNNSHIKDHKKDSTEVSLL